MGQQAYICLFYTKIIAGDTVEKVIKHYKEWRHLNIELISMALVVSN